MSIFRAQGSDGLRFRPPGGAPGGAAARDRWPAACFPAGAYGRGGGAGVAGRRHLARPGVADPAVVSGPIMPFLVLYAMHDAMVADARQGLALSFRRIVTAPEDGLTYDFVIRKSAKFHNGDRSRPRRSVLVRRHHGAANDIAGSRRSSARTTSIRFKNPWPD